MYHTHSTQTHTLTYRPKSEIPSLDVPSSVCVCVSAWCSLDGVPSRSQFSTPKNIPHRFNSRSHIELTEHFSITHSKRCHLFVYLSVSQSVYCVSSFDFDRTSFHFLFQFLFWERPVSVTNYSSFVEFSFFRFFFHFVVVVVVVRCIIRSHFIFSEIFGYVAHFACPSSTSSSSSSYSLYPSLHLNLCKQ